MSPAPRIGRSSRKPDVVDLSPTEAAARTAADIPLDAPLQDHEVAARVEAKERMLATLKPAAADDDALPVVTGEYLTDRAVAKLDLAGLLKQLGTVRDEARREYNEKRRAALVSESAPFITAIRSATTTHGQLKAQWLPRVEAVALLDWATVMKHAPTKLAPNPGGRGLVDVAHQALARLNHAADATRRSLLSTFGDSVQGKDDLDPVGAESAARAVEMILASDQWLHNGTDAVSQTYLRALSHLRVWAERATRIAESARIAVQRFQDAEAYANEMLADVQPRADVPPTPTREMVALTETKPPEFRWSGDVRTLNEEIAAHAATMPPPPIQPGSKGNGKIVGVQLDGGRR